MTTIEMLLLIAGIGLLNVLCFLIGAKTGQRIVNNEPVELPNINPMQAIKDYQEKKAEEKIEEEYKANLEAINNYDGNI